MWRYFKVVPRAIRQQWNSSIRPSPQSVHCEDDPEAIKKPSLLPRNYIQCYPERWQLEWGPEATERKASSRHRAQRQKEWSIPNCQNGFLEAVGWGTAILLGLQLSKLYHLKTSQDQRRKSLELDETCPLRWLQRVPNSRPSICYISSPQHPVPAPTDSRAGYVFPEDNSATESADRHEPLDYESLLDIEVRSQQFDCRLQCDFDEEPVLAANNEGVSGSTLNESIKKTQNKQEELDPEQRLQEAVDEWCILSNRCTARVHHQFAIQHLNQGQYDQAFTQWEQACHQGDPRAHFNLALCYELGKGTVEDQTKAVEHYAIAAAGGHHIAMYNLAVYYLTGKGGLDKDITIATNLLEKAAVEGLSQAQTDLGVLVGEQDGDWQQAASLFTSAAQKDDVSAKYYLGVCHENGWGVPCDLARAAELYTEAATEDHAMALHSLGTFKERGRGDVAMDRSEARDLYQKAARAGYPAAEADHRRLSHQLNQEKFESEIEEIQSSFNSQNGQTAHSRRSQSSPTLSHSSLSFYIRNNLLDFGLDEPHSPTHTSSGGTVKFQIGESVSDEPPPEPGGSLTSGPLPTAGSFTLGGGGFGDFTRGSKTPKRTHKAKGNVDSFDPSAFSSDLMKLKELEQQAEMRLVLCS